MKKGETYQRLQRARVATCKLCGVEFRAIGDHNGRFGGKTDRVQIYCSKECWRNRRVLKICDYCGKEIDSYHGKKYCNRECSFKAMVGEKASQWKDGKSLLRDRARQSTALTTWRHAVYNRDKNTCQKCGSKENIHAHHIIEWAKDETQRFEINNGIALCADCHGKVHGMNFLSKNKNQCPDCGKEIRQRSVRCRKCAAVNQWKRVELLKTN